MASVKNHQYEESRAHGVSTLACICEDAKHGAFRLISVEVFTRVKRALDNARSYGLRAEYGSVVYRLDFAVFRVDKEFVRCTMLGVKSQYFSKGEILIQRRGCEGWAVSTLYDGEGLR